MEKFTVTVTDKHIKKGVKQSEENCPVALALRSLRLKGVTVGPDDAEFTKAGKTYHFNLPKRAVTFVEKFDIGKTVKPFSFTAKPVERAEAEPEEDNDEDFESESEIDEGADEDEDDCL